MKKSRFITFLLLVLTAVTAICFTACGAGGGNSSSESPLSSSNSSSNSSQGSAPDSSYDGPACDEHDYKKVEEGQTFKFVCTVCNDLKKGYRIQFVYEADGSNADQDIEVSWIDENDNAFTAKTDENGYVEVLDLPNASYRLSVNHDTLPVINGVQYSYNNNVFASQSNGIGYIIPLFATDNSSSTGTFYFNDVEYVYNSIKLNETYVATLKSPNDIAWYALLNEGIGKYTVDASSSSNLNVEIDRYAGYYDVSMLWGPMTDVEKVEKNKMTYKVIQSDDGQNSNFCIKVPNAASYPVDVPFKVTITYQPTTNVLEQSFIRPNHFSTVDDVYTYYTSSRDENGDPITVENNIPSLKPANGVEKCKDVEGGTIKNMTETELSAMELRQDGYYYVNNQLVYAKIDAPSILQNSTLASIIDDAVAFGEGVDFGLFRVTKQDEYGCYIRNDNYFGFVQAYAALCNSDGLYPLTAEMKQYLECLVEKESASNVTRYLYEMLCTYSTQINNFSQGNGTQANPYVLALSEQTLGNYKILIPAGGKIYVTFSGNMDVVLSFNSNVAATYSITYGDYLAVDGTVNAEFTAKNGAEIEFNLTVKKYNNPSKLEVGSNLVTATKNGLYYEFIAPSNGNYSITLSTDVTLLITDENLENLTPIGELTYTFTEGQLVIFIPKINGEDGNEFEFELIIEKLA